jgi:hypothetical protein
VPLPLPPAPEVMVIQDALFVNIPNGWVLQQLSGRRSQPKGRRIAGRRLVDDTLLHYDDNYVLPGYRRTSKLRQEVTGYG